jgi:hypothetical protein
MTVDDAATAVLAFVRAIGPIGAVALVGVALVVTLAVLYLKARIETRIAGRKSFDVGGSFEHFYSRIGPAAREGVVHLIYAGYAALWLAAWPSHPQFRWLHQPFGNLFAGVAATAVVVWLGGKGTAELAKAAWAAWRWLRLEAGGVSWHIADSGEPYRILWRRRNGESLFDSTIRDHRLHHEVEAIRSRRRLLVTETAVAALSFVAWRAAPALIVAVSPLLPLWLVSFMRDWDVLAIVAWLILLFAVIPKTAAACAALLDELIYRAGAQFIPGAKVLDPRPVPLGRHDVEAQNAHGDADFVTPTEAVRRMAGQPEL